MTLVLIRLIALPSLIFGFVPSLYTELPLWLSTMYIHVGRMPALYAGDCMFKSQFNELVYVMPNNTITSDLSERHNLRKKTRDKNIHPQ